MEDGDPRLGSSPTVKAAPKRCSAFPGAAMARSFESAICRADGVNKPEPITGARVARIQPESLWRVLHGRSHHKRGPPMVLPVNS